MAAFFHGNGLKKHEADKILRFYNNKLDNSRKCCQKMYHFHTIFDYLDRVLNPNDPHYEDIRTKYNFYSMIANQIIFYDGFIRDSAGN